MANDVGEQANRTKNLIVIMFQNCLIENEKEL